jgi:hypothetical protein
MYVSILLGTCKAAEILGGIFESAFRPSNIPAIIEYSLTAVIQLVHIHFNRYITIKN